MRLRVTRSVPTFAFCAPCAFFAFFALGSLFALGCTTANPNEHNVGFFDQDAPRLQNCVEAERSAVDGGCALRVTCDEGDLRVDCVACAGAADAGCAEAGVVCACDGFGTTTADPEPCTLAESDPVAWIYEACGVVVNDGTSL